MVTKDMVTKGRVLADGDVEGGVDIQAVPTTRTALSDQGHTPSFLLHGAYYSKDRESGSHVCKLGRCGH